MSEVVSLDLVRKTKASQVVVGAVLSQMRGMYGQAGDVIAEFAALAETDLPAAIGQLPDFIARIRRLNQCPEAMCGGPNPDWVMPIVNAIGDSYAGLDAATREAFLRHCLRLFDGLNCIYVRLHVVRMLDALLVADITMNRPNYWPGLERECELLKRCPTSELLAQESTECLTTFWMALAVIWGDAATLPVRRWYYQHYGESVTRALDYAASVVVLSGERRSSGGEGDFETCVQGSLDRNFDPAWHVQIWERVRANPWIRLDS
ncbi:MAG: hypothetical protein PHT12_05100 [Patescibacteria group bacterium]|nr:hypothetical protein [Patescibacteria group bacterium]